MHTQHALAGYSHLTLPYHGWHSLPILQQNCEGRMWAISPHLMLVYCKSIRSYWFASTVSSVHPDCSGRREEEDSYWKRGTGRERAERDGGGCIASTMLREFESLAVSVCLPWWEFQYLPSMLVWWPWSGWGCWMPTIRPSLSQPLPSLLVSQWPTCITNSCTNPCYQRTNRLSIWGCTLYWWHQHGFHQI